MVELPDIGFKIARQILQNEIRIFLYADLATSAPTAVPAPFPVADCGNVYRELDGLAGPSTLPRHHRRTADRFQSAKAAKLNPCAIGVIACPCTSRPAYRHLNAPAGEKFAYGLGH